MRKRLHRGVLIFTLVIGVLFLVGLSIVLLQSSFSTKGLRSNYGKIAVIPIKGTIATENGDGDFFRGGSVGSGSLIGFIEQASRDPSVKVLLLNINSPGGTVVASKDIADAVKKVDKPVVALIREVGASGAYWIASASDYIIADPLSITGSIGVIGSYLEFSELFSEYGVKYQELTTGRYKDLGSPFKSLSERDREVLLGKLQIIHDYFVNEINVNRKKDLTLYGNGLFYVGTEAKDIGLVDELGGKDEAIAAAKRLAGIETYDLVFYEKKKTILDVLGKLSEGFGYSIGEGFGNKLLMQKEFDVQLR